MTDLPRRGQWVKVVSPPRSHRPGLNGWFEVAGFHRAGELVQIRIGATTPPTLFWVGASLVLDVSNERPTA